MRIVTGEQMREIDRITIEELDIPGLRLMEEAGKAVVEKTIQTYSPWNVAVLTGKGNNAGDGFVAARHLYRRGIRVVLYLLAGEDELSGDALTNYKELPEAVQKVLVTDDTIEQLGEQLASFDCIIDAILGTGIKGAVRGIFAPAIDAINATSCPVVAVDIPSGLYADATYFEGTCVHADMTVTMGLPKIGMVIAPGVQYCGKLFVAPLEFPKKLLNDPNLKYNLLLAEEVRSLFPDRIQDSNKKTFGYLLIVAGSPGMTGAAILASRAATRSGVGLVYTAVPQKCIQPVESRLIDPVKVPVTDSEEGCLTRASLSKIHELLPRIDAIAVGPGIGQHAETRDFVHLLLEDAADIPMVIDADGLNVLAGHLDDLKKHNAPLVLTPHPGEMARLIGGDMTPGTVQKNRRKIAREFAVAYGVVVVLKGFRTVVASPEGIVWINPTGNSGLAKGGSGDVLTGLIAGYMAQGGEPLYSALIGVYLHGLAGEVTARSLSERAMTPTDLPDYISKTYLALGTRDDDPRI